jgi:hypothetical protein
MEAKIFKDAKKHKGIENQGVKREDNVKRRVV